MDIEVSQFYDTNYGVSIFQLGPVPFDHVMKYFFALHDEFKPMAITHFMVFGVCEFGDY
jgi:hypothetical protein